MSAADAGVERRRKGKKSVLTRIMKKLGAARGCGEEAADFKVKGRGKFCWGAWRSKGAANCMR
jgi:hypothetical protein